MAMTIEDFAHRCLMIKAGNAELAIPCCANCKHYKQPSGDWHWYCYRSETGRIAMKSEDFCSRFEEKCT